jgi:hypothetical protein
MFINPRAGFAMLVVLAGLAIASCKGATGGRDPGLDRYLNVDMRRPSPRTWPTTCARGAVACPAPSSARMAALFAG